MDTKENVLNELYALRAGLSAISVEYDKTKEIERSADGEFIEVAKQLGGVGDFVNYVTRYGFADRYNCGKISNDNNENLINYGKWLATEKSREYYNDAYNGAANEKATGNDFNGKKMKLYRRLFWGFLALSIALFIGAVFLVFGGAEILSNSFEQFIGIFIGGIALGIVTFFIIVVCATFNSTWKKYRKCYKLEEERASGRYSIYLPLYNGYEAAHTRAANILSERNAKILPIKESCNEFYFALKKQFSQLLDERDWKNIDLVIYELETRRADSLKEALQLVDRELQTERIEQTIIKATEQICYEIRRGVAEITATIVECSRVISTQLAGISFQLEGVSAQLGKLTDAVNLGNALQAKANVSSAQIMNDISYIRYYSF